MSVTCHVAISLDGYVAGPNQTRDQPLGAGGERLHRWMFADEMHPADARARDEIVAGDGAYVMGRNMFAGPGEWEPGWRGWWGEDPPYHAPVFVLTHQEREPIEMQGGTTFHFVTAGPEAALEQARAVAGDLDVSIAGGASTVNQYLALGAVDELNLHLAPILLGGGARLFEGVGDLRLEQAEVVASRLATHLRYRITR